MIALLGWLVVAWVILLVLWVLWVGPVCGAYDPPGYRCGRCERCRKEKKK